MRFSKKTPRPTIVAKKNWKVTRDAQVLDQALDDKGILKAEKTIVEILCSCNAAQRMELKKVFKSQTKENLLQVLREELTNGNFLDLTLVMLREPLAFDIDMINVFIEDENRWPALIGLLMQKSKKELQMIEEKYENRKCFFKRELKLLALLHLCISLLLVLLLPRFSQIRLILYVVALFYTFSPYFKHFHRFSKFLDFETFHLSNWNNFILLEHFHSFGITLFFWNNFILLE